MRTVLVALSALLAVATARVVITAIETPHALGTKACTWGPGYWCQNITTAASCNSVHKCIPTWETMHVQEDDDSVCTICKDMVRQARDQLESNQTQEDLKAVFEGSCALIHIKPIVEECDKLVDQFIPELVDTLASQMDPSVVCSVSGLCNSAHIDQLLLEYQEQMTEDDEIVPKSLMNDELSPNECSKCYTIATHMEQKFVVSSRDEILENMLTICGRLSSLSDACSNIILTYFDTIYEHLRDNFNAGNVCHLSGQCSDKFHKHEDDEDDSIIAVEVRPLSSVGMVEIGDELPCKLCEQLVGHLRDLLVANTTEAEFEKVLEGLCKQTKSFSTECKAIVDEYYPQIYTYLTQGLDGNVICAMVKICPSPDKLSSNGPIWPLLPTKTAQIGEQFITVKKHNLGENGHGLRKHNLGEDGHGMRKHNLGEHGHGMRKHNLGENGHGIMKQTARSEAEEMQLPIERFGGPSSLLFPVVGGGNKQSSALCEYVLHFVQQAITNPATEDSLKETVEKICHKLPSTIQNDCQQFINVYGSAFIAILAQEIDPSTVCPKLHLCPTQEVIKAWESIPKDMVIVNNDQAKPSCPLCLFAVTQLYDVVKDDKTEASIEKALDQLCVHLPGSVKSECVDLVKIYSKELIEMLLKDLSPQEVCEYLKLCDATDDVRVPFVDTSFPTDEDGEIITNEIPDFPVYPVIKQQAVGGNTECVVCEFVMKQLEKSVKNIKTKDEIEKIVHGVCNFLPKTIGQQCNTFVSQYADVIIDMLVAEVSPQDICTAIGLCTREIEHVYESVAECALCQTVVSAIDKELRDPHVDEEIANVVSRVCKLIPASKQEKCKKMIKIYGKSLINLFGRTVNSKTFCTKLALCSAQDYLAMSSSGAKIRRSPTPEGGTKPCTWGSDYYCKSHESAVECGALNFCKENVWKGPSPPK